MTAFKYKDEAGVWHTIGAIPGPPGPQGPSGPAIPVVTALPVLPADGQECFYRFTQSVNPVDAKIIYWHLKYNAAQNAWYPVGRPDPIFALQAANEQTVYSANTWGGVTANDPLVTFPLTGDYEVEWGCGQFWVSAVGNWYIAAWYPGSEQTLNGTAPTANIFTCQAGGTWSGGQGTKKMAMAATQQLKQRYYVTAAGTLTRGTAFIKAYPRKISAA